MKTSQRIALLLASVLLFLSTPVRGDDPAQKADFHVAPGGDDSGPGTAERPFATLDRARRAVRERIAGGLTRDVVVLLHGGTYRIEESIVFGPEDSGAEEHQISYAAAPGETPVLSGGRQIRGWKPADGGIWKTVIPEVRDGAWHFRELFAGGERRPRARHPNEGTFRIEAAGPDDRKSFTYRPGDLSRPPDLDGVELVFYHDWSISRVGVAEIDEETRTVRLEDPVGPASRHFAMSWFEKDPRYHLEGSASFLDAPGEWHLDRVSGELRYRPLPGEDPRTATVMAPLASSLLEVRGDPEKGPVRNLHFTGLHLEHCAWPLPKRGYAAGQACFHEQRTGEGGALRGTVPTAIHFTLAEGCSFRRGRIAHLGGSGIWIGERSHENTLAESVLADISGNGVLIGEDRSRHAGGRVWYEVAPDEAATGNRIENCVIERCGRQFFGAVGIWVGMAQKTRIAHNVIRRLPYTGVSAGWMWNPSPTPCKENVIERNHIHHVMQVLSDGGGIYTLGLQPGTVLRENLIHDVPLNAGRAESNGMFIDEGSTGLLIEGNVIYAIERSPLRFHRATKNLVRGNVLVVSPGIPPFRYNATEEALIEKVENQVVEEVPRDALEEIREKAGLEAPHRDLLAADR